MGLIDLIVTGHWYDMIVSGEKTEEYFEKKSYWSSRLLCQATGLCNSKQPCNAARYRGVCRNRYSHVRFHRGYTLITATYEIEGITIGIGNPKWGAPTDKEVYIIKLGKRIEE